MSLVKLIICCRATGHSPRTPEVYVKDITKPALVKWFVDYDQSRLFLVFDEPVQLLDCSAIAFEFASGFNFTFDTCSTEYMEYGTTIVYRLLDDGVVSCETTSDGHGDVTEVCNTYQLSYSTHSSAEVARRMVALSLGDDDAFLSIAASALTDYAETPNYSNEISYVPQVGPGKISISCFFVHCMIDLSCQFLYLLLLVFYIIRLLTL